MLKTILTNVRRAFGSTKLDIPLKPGPCLVLGSAPDPVFPADFGDDWNLVTVNASQASAVANGLPKPDITVLSGIMLGNLGVNIDAKAALRNLDTKLMLLIERGTTATAARKIFDSFNYRFDDLVSIRNSQRAKIIKNVTGKDLCQEVDGAKISTGLFAIALCLHLKSPRVVATGFSLSKNGHAYSSSNYRRRHVDIDAAAINLLIAQGFPIVTPDSTFSIESGMPMDVYATAGKRSQSAAVSRL